MHDRVGALMGDPAVDISRSVTYPDIVESDVDPAQIPRPVLWKILIEPIKVEEKSEGGIVFAPETQQAREYLRNVGKVIAMGAGTYLHPKFSDIPVPCEVGDWVIFNSHTGMPVPVMDDQGNFGMFRLINDDEVVAVTKHPKALVIRV